MGRLEEMIEKQRRLEESLKADGASQQPTSVIEKGLVEQVQDNLAMVKELRAEIEQSLASVQQENYHLQYDVYQPKIRALEDERDQLMQGNTDAHEKERDQKQKEIDGQYEVVNQVKRILNFLLVDTGRDLAIDDDDVKPYRDRQKENLGYLFDDDYLKIKLFIVENDKPKNKFSLIAMGRCLFGDDLLKLRREYAAAVNTGHGYNIQVVIRDAPSVEELKTWQELPQAGKVFFELKGDYEKVKEEYLDVSAKYTPQDFKELMTDLCSCGNFFTILDSVAFRDGVIACGRCGKNMEKVREKASEEVTFGCI